VVVKNTGTVRLTTVDFAGDQHDCATDVLQPGSTLKCNVWRPITVAAFTEGSVVLSLQTLSAVPKGLAPPLEALPQDTATVLLSPAAAMDVSLNVNTTYSPPYYIDFVVTVSNIGAMVLDQVQLVTEGVVATFKCGPGAAAVPGALQPGEKRTCTAQVPLTLDMLDAGRFVAVVKGSATSDTLQVTASDRKTVTLAALPVLTASFTECKAPSAAGDNAVCTLTLGNAGNARLKSVSAGPACSTALLAPGDTYRCTWQQMVAQTDFDAADVQQQLYTMRAVVSGYTNSPVSSAVEQVVALQKLALPVAARVSLDTSVNPPVARKTGESAAASSC
jgi:hypothetical protein